MSPPRGKRAPLDPDTLRRRGRHQRAARRRRRRRSAVVAVTAILALGLAAGIGGTAGIPAYGSACGVEDRRFFAHSGVDLEGIARAAVADIRAGEIVEGGSTITQQLVRNLYISRERTVQRKGKEGCPATKPGRARAKP